MEKAVCKFLLLYALKYLKKIICNIEIFTCNLFLKQPEKAFYMILCFRVFKITLSVKFKVAFEYFQEHKMASVRDDMDMNPVMMDNPVFATGSSVNLFCPLCHEMFNNPRLLPCLHTFCKRCLENLVSRGQVRSAARLVEQMFSLQYVLVIFSCLLLISKQPSIKFDPIFQGVMKIRGTHTCK